MKNKYHLRHFAAVLVATAMIPSPLSAQDTSNTGTGTQANQKLTTGTHNTANGSQALLSNREGSFNTAVGSSALRSNTGTNNTAAGFQALFRNKTGTHNTAIGDGALLNNLAGSFNIAVGEDSGLRIRNGSNNITIGSKGLPSDSGTIRIGTPGIQKKTFIAGKIHGDGSGLRGIKGTPGPPGPAGAQGPPGPRGPAGVSPFTVSGTTAEFQGGNPSNAVPTMRLSGPDGALIDFINSSNLITFWNMYGTDRDFAIVRPGLGNALTVLRSNGFTGLGTDTPAARLDVAGSGWFRSHFGGLDSFAGKGVRVFYDTSSIAGSIFAYDYATNTPQNLQLGHPSSDLKLLGDVKIGSSSQYHATASGERLRIIRGKTIFNGTRVNGGGFTSSQTATGKYTLTFDQPFPLEPAVQITVIANPGEVRFASTHTLTKSSCGVEIFDHTGTPRNAGMSITITGER
jgi:hypothetical protein